MAFLAPVSPGMMEQCAAITSTNVPQVRAKIRGLALMESILIRAPVHLATTATLVKTISMNVFLFPVRMVAHVRMELTRIHASAPRGIRV